MTFISPTRLHKPLFTNFVCKCTLNLFSNFGTNFIYIWFLLEENLCVNVGDLLVLAFDCGGKK